MRDLAQCTSRRCWSFAKTPGAVKRHCTVAHPGECSKEDLKDKALYRVLRREGDFWALQPASDKQALSPPECVCVCVCVCVWDL